MEREEGGGKVGKACGVSVCKGPRAQYVLPRLCVFCAPVNECFIFAHSIFLLRRGRVKEAGREEVNALNRKVTSSPPSFKCHSYQKIVVITSASNAVVVICLLLWQLTSSLNMERYTLHILNTHL